MKNFLKNKNKTKTKKSDIAIGLFYAVRVLFILATVDVIAFS
jgi:hypothetical protein